MNEESIRPPAHGVPVRARKRTRHAEELVVRAERERAARALSEQLVGKLSARGMTRAAMIQRCLAAREGDAGTHTEYRFLRILKGAALPDAAQLEIMARALGTEVQDVLGAIDLAQLEALRQAGEA